MPNVPQMHVAFVVLAVLEVSMVYMLPGAFVVCGAHQYARAGMSRIFDLTDK